MPTITYSPSAQLGQIDDFPKDIERTVKGAIYVAPGRTAVVNDAEAAHLKARGVPFRVVGQPLKPITLPGSINKPTPTTPGATGSLPATPSGPLGGASRLEVEEPEPEED